MDAVPPLMPKPSLARYILLAVLISWTQLSVAPNTILVSSVVGLLESELLLLNTIVYFSADKTAEQSTAAKKARCLFMICVKS